MESEELEKATAALLIEIAFLIPKGDTATFARVSDALKRYRAALLATR